MNAATPVLHKTSQLRLYTLSIWAAVAIASSLQAEIAAANPASNPSLSNPEYYQDYQSVIVPAPSEGVTQTEIAPPPAPQPPLSSQPDLVSDEEIPPPPASEPEAIQSIPPDQPTSLPPQPPVSPLATPSSSLNTPVWVAPAATPPSAAASQATPLPNQPPPPAAPNRPVNSMQTSGSPELAVLVTDVQIVGVDPSLQDLGLRVIQTKPGSQTTPNQLQEDVSRLLSTGFFSAVTVSTQQNPQGLSVTFTATPTLLRSLNLTNANVLNYVVATEFFRDQFGKPLDPAALNQAVKQINDWYAKNGYTLARVLSLQPSADGILTIDVAEGVVNDVKLRYLDRDGKATNEKGQPIAHRSQDAFVLRQIKTKPGQIFQVDRAKEDLQRLSNLGIFQSANITFEGDARKADVVYNLVERPPRDLRFGGGYNDALGLFGSVSIQDVNFGGLGQQLGGNVLLGTRDVQFDARFVSPYRDTEPNVPGYSANLSRQRGLSNVFTDEVVLPNGDRVRELRYGVGVGLQRPLGAGWDGRWGLNYANVSTRDSANKVWATDEYGNPLTLSGTGVDDLFSFSFNALRDMRDNRLNPSTGSFTRINVDQYFPIGRGNVLGTRFDAGYAQFIPIKWITAAQKAPISPTESQPEVFAFNVQAGIWVGDLPPYNAFVLGGSNSVRAWDTGAIGSSRSYVQANAEYRFPIYKFIGGAAFFDFASDLGTDKDVPGQPAVIRDKPGTGFGAGFGLRVNSPLGIIRGDLGVSNRGDVRFQFGFGQSF